MAFFLIIFLGLSFSCCNGNQMFHRKLADGNNVSLCPMNFEKIYDMVEQKSDRFEFIDFSTECNFLLQGLRMVRSDYLQTTGSFTIPLTDSEACWDENQYYVSKNIPGFDVRSGCGVQTSWISNSCMNISTRSQFEELIPEQELKAIKQSCNQSLTDNSACESCVARLSSVQGTYFNASEPPRNITDCKGYPFIYAAAFANEFGPLDLGTAMCLFSLDLTPDARRTKHPMLLQVMLNVALGFLITVCVLWLLWKQYRKRRNRKEHLREVARSPALASELFDKSFTLLKFTMEELKEATGNFCRQNLIGTGGYGNVYRGVLANGSVVALKRFKNCSAAGDANFKHEVEVIVSVRHVNVVAFRGYCISSGPTEGHQRIIVCDLMRNGSLSDHLFGSEKNKLSWPIRRKIVLGIANGLAYLHNGVQPAIIHRDVKASNILLDESFEPKLADFGLAKFNPDGLSHMSTRVAGTLGYVAPEYAMYGQLTERSDVYSFGVLLLELLSGRKAVISVDGGQVLLLTDWAWSLVNSGQALDVIEEGMLMLDPPEVLEKYVLVAVLSTHPVLYARPTMDQILNVLQTELAFVPSIPDRPPSLLAEKDNAVRLLTSNNTSAAAS